jgi:hypothetical protein
MKKIKRLHRNWGTLSSGVHAAIIQYNLVFSTFMDAGDWLEEQFDGTLIVQSLSDVFRRRSRRG